MATILFYTPFNQRSRDVESLMLDFHGLGHHVISLSQQEGHLINDFLRSKNIAAHSYVVGGQGAWYFFRHLIYFVRFCWKHKVNVVYSHLESANFIASIAQYFIKSRVYLCRHHIDEGSLYGFDKSISYRITYLLASKIIVVSEHARRYMIQKEGIQPDKIVHINLAYDFRLFNQPDLHRVTEIRKHFQSEILLVAVCRLTKFKRPDFAIRTLKTLIDMGLDAKLVLLGKGEMYDDLTALIDELNLKSRIALPGFVNNVLEYLSASDFLIHPSLLDSSCVTVKEAGLVGKPVIVCKGIGDFEDYIINEKNGFTVDPEKFVEESASIIAKHHKDRVYLKNVGECLKSDVLKLFSAENVAPQYVPLNGPV